MNNPATVNIRNVVSHAANYLLRLGLGALSKLLPRNTKRTSQIAQRQLTESTASSNAPVRMHLPVASSTFTGSSVKDIVFRSLLKSMISYLPDEDFNATLAVNKVFNKKTEEKINTIIRSLSEMDKKDYVYQAIIRGNSALVNISLDLLTPEMITSNEDPNRILIFKAIDNTGSKEIIKKITNCYIQLKIKIDRDRNAMGETSFVRASCVCFRKNYGNVSPTLLMQAGADVHARDRTGRTALMTLANESWWSEEDIARVRFLLKLGIGLEATDPKGRTAFLYAIIGLASFSDDEIQTNQFLCLNDLIEAGANIFARDFSNNTALHYAANGRNTKVVKWLLQAYEEKIRKLLSLGSNSAFSSSSSEGVIGSSLEQARPNLNMEAIFRESFFETRNVNGLTPLMYMFFCASERNERIKKPEVIEAILVASNTNLDTFCPSSVFPSSEQTIRMLLEHRGFGHLIQNK